MRGGPLPWHRREQNNLLQEVRGAISRVTDFTVRFLSHPVYSRSMYRESGVSGSVQALGLRA